MNKIIKMTIICTFVLAMLLLNVEAGTHSVTDSVYSSDSITDFQVDTITNFVYEEPIEYSKRVFDIKTNEGIENVKVLAVNQDTNEEYVEYTDSEGYFKFFLAEGRYTLTFIRSSYKDNSVIVDVFR